MPKVTRLSIAKADIEAWFEAGPHVLRAADIQSYLDEKREFWRLAQYTNLKRFIEFLLTKSKLRRAVFAFPHRKVEGYTWGSLPTLMALQGLLSDSYCSHYTAMTIHGLTEQVPKTIYITSERSGRDIDISDPHDSYPQESIDAAFAKEPRTSKNECQVGDLRIFHLNSAYHAAAGVTTKTVNYGEDGVQNIRVTTIERTLVDSAVRPFYCGGVAEVLKAFVLAANQDLSVNRMGALVSQLNFGYPYHQAIGFYLERAGYRSSLLDIFRRLPMDRKFYLTHKMGEVEYVKDWKLFIPKGL